MLTRTASLLWSTVLALFVLSSEAQVCSDVSGVAGVPAYTGLATSLPMNPNCVGIWNCRLAIPGAINYSLSPGGCDPEVTTCTAIVDVTTRFPGNRQSYFPGTPPPNGWQTPPDSLVKLVWTNGNSQFTGSCGNMAAKITHDEGIASLSLAFNCAAAAADPNLYKFTLAINTCQGLSQCTNHSKTVNVDFGIGSGLCPEPPPEDDCDDDSSCKLCKSTGGGLGGGSASAAGGGGAAGGRGTGAGAHLRYKAGAIGHPNLPGSSAWTAELGRYWSHDYAERLFVAANPAPAASKVYQVTASGIYRTFTDLAGDGLYEGRKPASVYDTLETAGGGGWTLTSLDGTVKAFDANGRWQSTTDRFGNAKTATYTSSQLTQVDFPDSRHEEFTYHPSGKLASLTEVGIDGITARIWSYTWTGDDLTRIDMPDGRALEYFYSDGAHPGFMTRTELVGDDGSSRRVTAAWEYDTPGNVVKIWKGSAAFATGVERWQFAFDDPVVPRVTTVTDPLGDISTYTLDTVRGSRTEKAKLVELSGDCPSCGTGPNSQLFYTDAANPFRVTREVNGRGYETRSSWNAHGQLEERIEAFGTPGERTTTYTYDVAYPALWTAIERPSTTGLVTDFRRIERTFDAEGRLFAEISEGIESTVPFSLVTSFAPTAEGMTATIDPPGYGTADQTSFTYDPDRGNLVAETRTDPLIGTTTFGYDPFHRRTSTTDVNGVVTETTYDDGNRVLTVTEKGATVAEDRVTESRYDTFGDLFQTILPEGNVIELGYDAAGRLTSTERKPDDQPSSHGERIFHTLNGAGQRTLEQRQSWNGSSWVTVSQTAWQYSTRCHLDLTTNGLPGEQSVAEQAYDCNGNVVKIWDANHPSAGQTATPSTSYEYDELDRLELVRQPFGGASGGNVETGYLYDIQDHLVRVTDANGTVTSYIYSDRDLMTREVSEVSGTTNYTYNEHGQLTFQLDARGIATNRVVDAIDRVTSIDLPGTDLDVAYTFDDPLVPFSIGRLTRITRGWTQIDYAYDRFGRTIQDGGIGYTFDKNGNAETMTYPGGLVASYTYDYADRPSTLSATPAGGSAQAIVTTATYRPFGAVSSLTLGNGLTETRDYDSREYPERILVPGKLDWQYTVDGVGNPTAIDDGLAPANDKTYAYQDYQYFQTTGNGPWGTRGWTYDKIGNRLTETRGAVTDTYSYVANAASGRSPKIQQVALGGGGTRTFTYDSAGNETQAGSSVRTFDASGKLGSLSDSPAQAASSFVYDGRGFLAEAIGTAPAGVGSGIFCDGFESGNTSAWGGAGSLCLERIATRPIFGSEGRLYQVRRGGRTENVLYFSGRLAGTVVESTYGTSYGFLSNDHLGTPVLASNHGAAISWSGGFEAFGTDWNGAQSAGVFLRLPGQWTDPVWSAFGGLDTTYQNLNRWYVPGIGRYSSADPAIMAWDIAPSPLSYAESRPLFYKDPAGLWRLDESCQKGCTGPCGFEMSGAAVMEGIGWSCRKIKSDGPCRRAIENVALETDQNSQKVPPGFIPCLERNCNPNTGFPLVCRPCFGQCGESADGVTTLGGGGFNKSCPAGNGLGYGPTLLHEALHQCGLSGEPSDKPPYHVRASRWRYIEFACSGWRHPDIGPVDR
jgi:RHS repeat-associated protein